MADRLTPGQSLAKGARLTSANGAYSVVFQTDGNLVLVNRAGQAIWSPGIVNRGGARAVMQTDGNFVVYTAQNAPVFATGTQGRPGAFVIVQDDGNVVIYHGRAVVWSSRTQGGQYHPDEAGWLAKAVNTTLHAPSNLAKAVAQEVSKVAPDAAKFFKNITQSPYWKVVAGAAILIPGAGIAVSAGMAAATAVGKAASVKDAIIGVAREAIPGEAGKVGFDAANGVLLQGKPIDAAALDLVRTQLAQAHPEALAGFDAASALHTGRFTQFQAPPQLANAAKAAFYTAQGLRGAPATVAQAVHRTLGIATDPLKKEGFTIGVKAAKADQKSEQAQLALTALREVMRKYRRKDPTATARVGALIVAGAKGDAKAKSQLTMLAIADRANRELDGKRTPAALVHVSGFPLGAFSQGAMLLSSIATIPFDWIRTTFFHDKAAA